jgi:hypothetical protein
VKQDNVESRRDTSGKPTLDVLRSGDPEISALLAEAVAAVEPVSRATHGFHSYPAGLHPDAARALVRAFPGRSVLDPFCGGGTVLVEGRLAGRRTYGRDLSSVALRVSRARTSTPDEATLTAMRSTARRLAEDARHARDLPPPELSRVVQEWYAPHVLYELWSLRSGIARVEDPLVRRLLEAILSSILVKVSWRKSDTSAQREKHDRPQGTTSVLFHKKARELGRMIAELREQVPAGTPATDLGLQDAREVTTPEPVDLVVTSPPYPAIYDYLPMQHLRRVWLGGGEGEDPRREIGARRSWREASRQARHVWVEDTYAWTAAVTRCLARNGVFVTVVGDGLTPTGPIDTAGASKNAADRAGLELIARASLLRPDHARETTRWEHVLAWRKTT